MTWCNRQGAVGDTGSSPTAIFGYIGEPMTPDELRSYLTTLGLGAGAAGTLTALVSGIYIVIRWCAGAKQEWERKQEADRIKDERHEQQSLEWEKRFMEQAHVMEEMQTRHIAALRKTIEDNDALHVAAIAKVEQRHRDTSLESEKRCNERLDQLAHDHERDKEELMRNMATIQVALMDRGQDAIVAQLEEIQQRNKPKKGVNGNA